MKFPCSKFETHPSTAGSSSAWNRNAARAIAPWGHADLRHAGLHGCPGHPGMWWKTGPRSRDPIYWVANHPNWLIFFRGFQTTNQPMSCIYGRIYFLLNRCRWILQVKHSTQKMLWQQKDLMSYVTFQNTSKYWSNEKEGAGRWQSFIVDLGCAICCIRDG